MYKSQNQQNRGGNRLLILFSILAVIIIIDACRKIDYRRDSKHGIIVNHGEKFFTVPPNTDPRVKAIADRIKRQNDTAHFVDNLAERIGYPVWNKSLIASPPKQSRNNIDSSEMVYLYIPFDNDSTIDATLIVRTTPEDTLFKLLNDRQYSMAGFDTTNSNVWNARNVFHLFAKFEKEVFGHNTLQILDRRLFPGGDTTLPISATLRSSSTKSARLDVLEAVTMCDLIDVCYAPPGESLCDDGECTLECPQYTHTEYDCFTFWVEDGWGGGDPPYIPWGGGGGSPWYESTCGNNGVYCGPPGWITPEPGVVYDGYGVFETWELSSSDVTRINNFKNNNIDTTGLDTCVRKILDKLLNGQNLIGRILAKMDAARFKRTDIEKFKLIVRVGPITGNANAQTIMGPLVNGFSIDTIVLKDSVVLRGSELGIARVLMHEVIHAYMGSIMKRYFSGQYSTAQINSMGIDSVFDIYIDSLIAVHHTLNLHQWNTAHPQYDHDFMADKLLDMFVSAMAWVDDNRNTDEYYWHLAWGGLFRTKTWQKYWPNYYSTPPANWPPTYPAPNDDSTWGLRYAFTQARIDSIWHHGYYELTDTSKAKGRHKIPGACY